MNIAAEGSALQPEDNARASRQDGVRNRAAQPGAHSGVAISGVASAEPNCSRLRLRMENGVIQAINNCRAAVFMAAAAALTRYD